MSFPIPIVVGIAQVVLKIAAQRFILQQPEARIDFLMHKWSDNALSSKLGSFTSIYEN